MLYHIETDERTVGGQTATVYTLLRRDIGSSIEVWPTHGFNCLRWRANGRDLLYAAPAWENQPVPTRSGVPILFPFPNRIRNGMFVHGDRTFHLPKNDPAGANAIHGFAPRRAWRIFGYGADMHSAWVHGDFQLSTETRDSANLWPGDGLLSVIYRLAPDRLRIEMRVRNMGDVPFPFGVGLHPYFRFPCDDADISRYVLDMPARSVWPLVDNLPTGEKGPIPDSLNFNRPRTLAHTQFDTVYGDLGAIESQDNGMLLRATIAHTELPGRIEMWTSADFRESVLFTPPHRNAVCVEPYTCVTDAVNLQCSANGGWKELPVGGSWAGVVELRWNGTE